MGVGAPGPIDGEGTVYNAVNLGWGTFSIKNQLQGLLNIPVEAGNDANVAALGEMWKGGGQAIRTWWAVTLGTGVGGGIIADGRILSGPREPRGNRTHPCDGRRAGNVQLRQLRLPGAVHLRNRYRKSFAKRRLAADDKPSNLRGNDSISAKTVFDAVKAGDELAIEVAEQFGEILGKELAPTLQAL